MTQVMNLPGLGLSAPSSRQDIISALLNDYGNSFGQGDSVYGSNPVPALKELPPPPPSSSEKPLPSAMSMRFQLRDEQATNDGRRTKTIESPTKIVSRSITRSSKPPSLKLLGSNGATALSPSPPAPKVPAKGPQPSTNTQQSLDERPLPPPPPEKSIRRKSIQKPAATTMGNIASKSDRDRRDSKEPENSVGVKDEQRSSQTSQASQASQASYTSQASQATKRKPLPGSTLMKRFPSLADLKNGPRGRKPSTTTTERESVSSRKSSQDSSETITPASHAAANRSAPVSRTSGEETAARNAISGHRPKLSKSSQPSELPPTPDELLTEKVAPLPPVPRKVYAGLPSNPRARRQEPAPQPPVKHVRGKSSTGFDMMKSSNPTSNVQPTVDTITPRPTPPPIESKTENVQKEENQVSQAPPSLAITIQAALKAPDSPVSPISDIGSSRPFSYEVPPPPQIIVRKPTFQESQERKLPLPPIPAAAPNQTYSTVRQNPSVPGATLNGPFSPGIPAPTDSPSPTNEVPKTQFPPRTSSRPAAPQESSQPLQGPRFPFPNTDENDFKPLTRAPVPLAPRPITERQLGCYTHHSNFSEYLSRFQRTGCSVCKKSELGVKATCSWCTLQLCAGCRGDLFRIPGRDLRVLLERREAGEAGLGESSGGGGIIWEEDGE